MIPSFLPSFEDSTPSRNPVPANLAGPLRGKTVSNLSKVRKTLSKHFRTLSKVFLPLEKLKYAREKVFLPLEKLKCAAHKVFLSLSKLKYTHLERPKRRAKQFLQDDKDF
jgi:hypothetical protein